MPYALENWRVQPVYCARSEQKINGKYVNQKPVCDEITPAAMPHSYSMFIFELDLCVAQMFQHSRKWSTQLLFFNAFYTIQTTFYIRFYLISTQQDTISDIDGIRRHDRVLPPKTVTLQIDNFLIRQLSYNTHSINYIFRSFTSNFFFVLYHLIIHVC